MSITDQIKGILIGVDEAAAAVLFAGMDDITISSRCGMALLDKAKDVYDPGGPHGIEAWALNALAARLDDIQKDHCIQSILGDWQRTEVARALMAPYVAFLSPVTLKR